METEFKAMAPKRNVDSSFVKSAGEKRMVTCHVESLTLCGNGRQVVLSARRDCMLGVLCFVVSSSGSCIKVVLCLWALGVFMYNEDSGPKMNSMATGA